METWPTSTRQPVLPRQIAGRQTPSPLDGESLASWITAVAASREVEGRSLLAELRLSTPGALGTAQVRLSRQVTRALVEKTGIVDPLLQAMTLAKYAGTALPHLPPKPWRDDGAFRQWRASAWVSLQEARWCGQCLRDAGGRWPLRWMLPWSFVCLTHSTYMATECIRCLSPVPLTRDAALPRLCEARSADDRYLHFGYADACSYPLTMHRPVQVSDGAVLQLQERINAWLEGNPTSDDRQLVAVTAALVFLLTPAMLRHRGEDPALLCGMRIRRPLADGQRDVPWAQPLRVAAAAVAAQRLLDRTDTPAEVAQRIVDLRYVDYRLAPVRLDVMEWAYGSALRPNPYIDELARRRAIVVGDFAR